MEYEEVIDRLKDLGDERARKVWARLGMDAKKYFGVNLTKIKGLSRKVGRDHDLAERLWRSDIHDAQLLACHIEEPKKVSEEQLDSWISDIDFIDLTDKFCSELVFKTPYAKKKMKEWVGDEREYYRRSGFVLVSIFARKGKEEDINDEEFIRYLGIIEDELQSERNWVREVMNFAVINIGMRSPSLKKKALETAKKIGEVEVDYGEANCIVPDAVNKLSRNDLKLKLI